MGQFTSRDFDGDPYIDLMRSLPERELVWWAQKVIWLAEGFTFVNHFTRSFPRLFQHKCPACRGAGVMTCPACRGSKVVLQDPALRARTPSGAHRLPALPAAVGADGQPGDCRMCGRGCTWDEESDWGERWREWEATLAYYDKSLGPLMDEWYEDVLNAGNLEEDTPPVEDEPPGPEVTGRWADEARALAKDKKRMAALMRRFGHPYDADANLGYQIVDPTATMGENVWNMAQVYNTLPPELNPLRTAHLRGDGHGAGGGAAQAAQAAEAALDAEVVMEMAILQNLEAAAQGLPKPHRFGASAGTVPCGACRGIAWQYSVFPNAMTFFGLERPLWGEELARLQKCWNPTASDPARTGHVLPYGEHGLRSLLANAGGGASPVEVLTGPVPKSTRRYRRELELLVAHPELRDAAETLPGSLLELVEAGGGGGGARPRRDLADEAVPLE